MEKPKFIIKNDMQKSKMTGVYFKNLISRENLSEICIDLTGERDYEYEFVDKSYEDDILEKTYNKGRLGLLYYQEKVYFISFSDNSNKGRNSAIQSVSTAFNIFYHSKRSQKELCFYFFPETADNITNYHIFMYRLMATIGFRFINIPSALEKKVKAFNSIEDIILARKSIAERNPANNPTYILKNGLQNYSIYGKTYGANKYDTSLICYAISSIASNTDKITLFQYNEKDLKELPKPSISVLKQMGNIKIINIDDEIEKQELQKNNSIRSPRFNARLLDRFGEKKCILCNCEISEIIQGAHIWPVSDIKNKVELSLEQQINYATDVENGLWMCQNHHKLFDSDLIRLTVDGIVKYDDNISELYSKYIDSITTTLELPSEIITPKYKMFIEYRNERFVK